MKRISAIAFLILFLSTAPVSKAQCPMCRSAVESAMKDEGNSKGLGLNDGILYLLAVPYLAAAVVGSVWWAKRRRQS
jgi:hypothetical protein